jgi:hypothetical protein
VNAQRIVGWRMSLSIRTDVLNVPETALYERQPQLLDQFISRPKSYQY